MYIKHPARIKKITVLGAGLVGNAIALDFNRQHRVVAADADAAALQRLQARGVATAEADLSDSCLLQELIEDSDLVVDALPGFLGFEALRACIEAGKNVVDISFFPEDAFALDESARLRGVTAVVDCGVAPGMSNILLGHYGRQMKIRRFQCLVGGLPQVRQWPWEYRAVFSPADVIEEYIRPARYVEGGRIVTREALSDPELIDFPGIRTLEAFNSDRLTTMPDVPDMIEKTLRYPGSAEYLSVLRTGGSGRGLPIRKNLE